jgi:hypothetical protein
MKGEFSFVEHRRTRTGDIGTIRSTGRYRAAERYLVLECAIEQPPQPGNTNFWYRLFTLDYRSDSKLEVAEVTGNLGIANLPHSLIAQIFVKLKRRGDE